MRIILIILLFGIYMPLSAQFNIAVGYSLGYTNAEETNALVFDFNQVFRDEMYFGNPMEELHFLHGINVGARWKYDNISFELNWENMSRSREALGEDNFDQLFSKTVSYSLNNYIASVESHTGSIGVGLGGGLRNFKVQEEIAASGEDRAFIRHNQFFLKPFISINLIGGERVGLSIKPYFTIPLNNIPLDALSKEFELGPSGRTERLWMGGVSFIFYNGAQ